MSDCGKQLVNGRGGERGWARSQIILLRESLVLYKAFKTLFLQYRP